MNWGSHVDLKTGRPVEYPYARYKEEGRLVVPGPSGGRSWNDIVIGGVREQQGMRSFAAVLDDEASEAIRAYVIDRAPVSDTKP